MLLPSELGEFPIMPFTQFLYRGHPDPLTASLAWIEEVSRELPAANDLKGWISSRIELKSTVSDSDFPRLIMDPVSLNMNYTSGYQQRGRKILENKVPETVKNTSINY